MSIATKDHSTHKGDVRLAMRQKRLAAPGKERGTILFVHGSTWAGLPTFDLNVPGRPHSSALDYFAEQGFDAWTVDNEGYGLSDKSRPINCNIANGCFTPLPATKAAPSARPPLCSGRRSDRRTAGPDARG